jgi:hypothetical protein
LYIKHLIAKKGHALPDAYLQRIYQRKHRDNGKNPDSNTEKGKKCAQQIGPEGSQSKPYAFQPEKNDFYQN